MNLLAHHLRTRPKRTSCFAESKRKILSQSPSGKGVVLGAALADTSVVGVLITGGGRGGGEPPEF